MTLIFDYKMHCPNLVSPLATRWGHSQPEIPLYNEEELRQDLQVVKQDLDNAFYSQKSKSFIPKLEYSQEISEYLADPSKGKDIVVGVNQSVQEKLSEQDFKEYVNDHIQELRDTIKVSPEYLTNTLRLTKDERERYVKEVDNLSYQGLVEYYNKGWKNANIHYILWLGKSLDAIEKLGFTESQKATVFYDYEFSDGSFTLDFCQPSPFPEHTYDTLPIIKETPN